MKKIHNNSPIKLSPVKIYWDDLEEIYNRIQKGRNIEIESGEYKYSDLKELKEKTKKIYINQIKLTGRSDNFDNYIHVNISSGGVCICQEVESTETAAKIKEILKKNSPWYMYSPNSPAWYIITGALISSIFSLGLKIENIRLSMVAIMIGFVIMLWAFKNEPILGGTKIFTCLRKDNLSFLERNKDELLKSLIIVLIVGIVNFLFGYILPK